MNPSCLALLQRCLAPCLAAVVAMPAPARAEVPASNACLAEPAQQSALAGTLSSVGDQRVRPLMDAWLPAFQQRYPGIRLARWDHTSDARAFGALMFETADMAPLARAPYPTELAPYAHQFAGDMMKSPLLVRVAGLQGQAVYIAVNKRPGSPLPPPLSAFLCYALSAAGQAEAARHSGYSALTADEAAAERAKLDGYLAGLDPALPGYQPAVQVKGDIASVGSDGMKTLMDRWMREFHRLQPGVRKGERWEHLGTLNGFLALIGDDTDLAPMGRELWPSELAAYESARGPGAPLEIRVARGGFNTPQRTTAQVVFVHPSNPLPGLTLEQLQAIVGNAPRITRWGQLGLKGEWAERPVHLYMPPAVAPNAMSVQLSLLKGGAWNASARQGTIAETAAAVAADPAGIAFGGLEEAGTEVKPLALATASGAPWISADYASASSGRYPLTRYMYIRLNRTPGKPVPAHIREFLRYILSRQGQEPIRYSGYYPLSAREAQEELDKLR